MFANVCTTESEAHGVIREEFRVDKLDVSVAETAVNAGALAGEATASWLREATSGGEIVSVVFAAAPSQLRMLEYLRQAPGINWSRVHAFHMDEYLDLPVGAPQRFGTWLTDALFAHLPFGKVTLMRTEGPLEQCASDYAEALGPGPVDLVCLGIGENGHLAFNDPPLADLEDSQALRVVELDGVSRQQQVNDGLFSALAEVPRRALTLTIPRLLNSRRIVGTAPGRAKREAVRQALFGEVSMACPASVLRRHPNAQLFLDGESFPIRQTV